MALSTSMSRHTLFLEITPIPATIWTKVSGVERPIQVCSEWLDVTDPTGQVHKLRKNEPLAMGVDGDLYYPNARKSDHQLLGLLAFAVVVIFIGMRVKRFLIDWYQLRLHTSSQ